MATTSATRPSATASDRRQAPSTRVAGTARGSARPCGFVADAATRRHGLDQPCVAADDRAAPDHRVAAEDGRARVDRDVVLDRRIAEDDLLDAVRRRVALERRQHVLRQERPERGDLPEEREGHGLGPFGLARGGGPEPLIAGRPPDLLDEDLARRIKMGGDRETQLRLVERSGGVVAEVHDRLQMPERLDHLALVRQLGAAQAIDQPPSLVAGRHLRDHVLELAQTVDGHGSFPNPPTVLPANRPGEIPAGYRLSRPEARIRRPEWAILPAVRAALLPLVLLLGLAGAAVPAEQTVASLPPVTEP